MKINSNVFDIVLSLELRSATLQNTSCSVRSSGAWETTKYGSGLKAKTIYGQRNEGVRAGQGEQSLRSVQRGTTRLNCSSRKFRIAVFSNFY